MKKLLFIISIFFTLSIHAKDDKGGIKGKILDKKTGEELIGVNVVIDGTNIGAVTDMNGNYVLQGLTPGSYNIKIMYIAYKPETIKNVFVKENEFTVLDKIIEEDALGLEEVVVRGKKITRTANAVLAVQRKAANLLAGISSEEISLQGASDVASSLKKITGVTISGGKYANVRGLEDKYVTTELDGLALPSMDPGKDAVQLDIFPSAIVDNILVYKTFTPDLPGNFAGGYINIKTKDFPDKFYFNTSTSLEYNERATFQDILSYKGGKLDWLAIDDGTRDIPSYVKKGVPPRGYGDGSRLTKVTEAFNKNMSPEYSNAFMNHSHAISFGDKLKLFDRTLGYNASLSYRRKFKYFDDGYIGKAKLRTEGAENLDLDNYGVNETGEEKVLWSALANISYLFNDNNKVRFNILHNHSGSKLANSRDIWSSYHDLSIEKRALLFVERAFTGFNLNGEHKFENDLRIDWMSAMAIGTQSEPDFRIFENIRENINGKDQYSIESSKHDSPTRFFRDLSENNIVNKINFEFPFKTFNHVFKFKTGLGQLYKTRTYREKQYIYDDENKSYNGNISDYLKDSNIGNNTNGDFGVFITKIDTEPYSYDATLSLYSGFTMIDVNLFEKFRIITGVRAEKSDYLVESKDESKEKSEPDYFDILPSLNTTYKLTDKINIRSSFNRTLARPSFRELSPVTAFDFFNGETVQGNKDLKRSIIDNVDIKFEYFPSSGEVLSIGAFAKYFNDPIEKVYMAETVNPTVTFINSDEATVYGIEFEIKKKLGFINPYLKHFMFASNVTLVNSTVNVSEDGYSDDKRRLAGQAPYIINASLIYKNKDKGTSASVNFNVTGEKIAIVQPDITPNVMEQPDPQLDFVFKQKLNKAWSMSIKVKNILDSEKKKIYEYKGKEETYSSYKLGRTYSVGFSYKIN